jgi:hypothetical protein
MTPHYVPRPGVFTKTPPRDTVQVIPLPQAVIVLDLIAGRTEDYNSYDPHSVCRAQCR